MESLNTNMNMIMNESKLEYKTEFNEEKIELEESANKITLLTLETQIGKTFTTINRIKTELEQDCDFGKSVHMVYTMNTLLNNKQFAKRLEVIEDTYGKGSVCVFASSGKGKYTYVRDMMALLGHVVCGNCRVVVMCSNKIRFTDGIQFIKRLNQQTIVKRLFMYYDELHKYINEQVRLQIEDIHILDIVKGIIGMSATPDNIMKKTGFWSRIKLIDLEDFDDSNYSGCGDVQFNCIDDFFTIPYVRPRGGYVGLEQETISFIQHVLTLHPTILADNTRSFIPAHVRRNGHELVRDIVLTFNERAVVVILNGKGKILQFKDDTGNIKTIPLISDDDEICEVISRVIIRNNLQYRALVITGFLCVGMGQTLTHSSLGSFTSAIFGHMDLPSDDIYQLFGRVTGRMKNWGDKYVQTQVYCPTVIMTRCVTMEICAKRCRGLDDLTQEVYREPMAEEKSAFEVRPRETKQTRVESLNKRIPVVIQLSTEEMETILSIKGKNKRQSTVKEIIISKCEEGQFKIVVSTKNCIQCSIPKVDTKRSYKMHITDVALASQNQKQLGMMDMKEEFKEITCWQVYIDTHLNRLIVLWQVYDM